MPLRVAFDMDGVLADFGQAFRAIENRLFGANSPSGAGEPARLEENRETNARRSEDAGRAAKARVDDGARFEDDARERMPPLPGDPQPAKVSAGESRRRRDLVWRNIQSTANFWLTLRPIDPHAVRRIHEMTLRHQWEVFFVTQRPMTDGDTVQRQTQAWLVEQGFDLPSVIVLAGSRGAAAAALRLDYLVDDSAQNCLDVIADSSARPILIVPDNDESTVLSARNLGVGTARSIAECLDILEKATLAQTQPGLLQRLASLVGWR
jgi:phosphoglycolate phosphatase-like HAD superfamily hydrolase